MIREELPLITIVVPIYNVEKYLTKCIESIIKQTYVNIQIILVDDGSTDSCYEICKEYKNKDNRIEIIHKSNGGLSDARNIGIESAQGEFITFIDSDDYIENEYIEYLFKILIDNNADVSICDYKYVNEQGKIGNKYKNNDEIIIYNAKEALYELCKNELISNSAWAKLYKIELFRDIRYPKGRIFEDIATTYKVFDKANRIVFGGRPLYNYLYRKSSISKKGFSINRLNAVEFVEEMTAYIENKYGERENLCRKRRFVEYIYAYKTLCESKNYNKQIGIELFIKMKENIEGIEKSLNIKMKMYLWSIKLGYPFLYITTKFENAMAKIRM